MKYFTLYLCVLMSLPVFSQDWESIYAEKNLILNRADFSQKMSPWAYVSLLNTLIK